MAKSYAKINLILSVFPKTHEHYHKIFSIANKVSLADEVNVSLNDCGEINIKCDNKEVPTGSTNTVYKILKALNAYANIDQGYDVEIKKNIPLQAGLGGGSSNAATALVEACKLVNLNYSTKTLIEISKGIGSDIPQFFFKSSVVIEGEGEIIHLTPNNLQDYIVLVKPNFGVSTKEAYDVYDKIGFDETADKSIIDDLGTNNYKEAISKMSNDLEYPVLEMKPELKKLKQEMLEQGLDFVMLSGSGSTFFGLTQDKELASKVVEHFKKAGLFSTLVEKVY